MVNWPVCTQQMHCVSIRIFGTGGKLAAYVIILCKGCEKTTAPVACRSVFLSWQKAG